MESWREELYLSELYHSLENPRYDELYHYGIPGMKWYIRRYQNADGSLKPAGYRHYGVKKPDGREATADELKGNAKYSRDRENYLRIKRSEAEKDDKKFEKARQKEAEEAYQTRKQAAKNAVKSPMSDASSLREIAEEAERRDKSEWEASEKERHKKNYEFAKKEEDDYKRIRKERDDEKAGAFDREMAEEDQKLADRKERWRLIQKHGLDPRTSLETARNFDERAKEALDEEKELEFLKKTYGLGEHVSLEEARQVAEGTEKTLRQKYGIDEYKAPEQVREIAREKEEAAAKERQRVAKEADDRRVAKEDVENTGRMLRETDRISRAQKDESDRRFEETKRLADEDEANRKRMESEMEAAVAADRQKKKTETNNRKSDLDDDTALQESIKKNREATEANSKSALSAERYKAETERIRSQTDRQKAENDLRAARRAEADEREKKLLEERQRTAKAYVDAASYMSKAGGAFSAGGGYMNSTVKNGREFLSNQTWTRYSEKQLAKMSNDEFRQALDRMDLERRYSALTANDQLKGKQAASDLLYSIGALTSAASGVVGVAASLYSIKNKVSGGSGGGSGEKKK